QPQKNPRFPLNSSNKCLRTPRQPPSNSLIGRSLHALLNLSLYAHLSRSPRALAGRHRTYLQSLSARWPPPHALMTIVHGPPSMNGSQRLMTNCDEFYASLFLIVL
ncbi:hypothetical protein LINPERPRIM_LOCUS2747, partial [Linum perenne]